MEEKTFRASLTDEEINAMSDEEFAKWSVEVQLQDAIDALKWTNLNEAEVVKEINGVTSRTRNVSSMIKTFYVENVEFKKMQDAALALVYKDLTASGWIPSFVEMEDEFDYNVKLPPDKEKVIARLETYCSDAKELVPILDKIAKLMMSLPLEATCILGQITVNLMAGYFNEAYFSKLDNDFKSVSDFIDQDWIMLDYNARNSAKFFEDNCTRMTPKDLEAAYRKERIKDYIKCLSQIQFHSNLTCYETGSFCLNAETTARLKALDQYTWAVSCILKTDLDSDLEEIIESCNEISAELDQVVPSMEEAFKQLGKALKELLDNIHDFANSAKVDYDDFDSASDTAPYCFMNKLPAFGSVKKNYSLPVTMQDPKEYGTNYYELYTKAAEAVTEHCKDWAYKGGQQFRSN